MVKLIFLEYIKWDMAIAGIGIDVADIDRFEKLVYEENKNFYERIFTDEEIEYCLKKTNPYLHFAARFCAKEAFIKAADAKLKDLKKIEVVMDGEKPRIKTSLFQDKSIHLSMSHSEKVATAIVLTEK